MHVRKVDIRKTDMPRLASVMSHGKKQQGPRTVDKAKKTTVAGRHRKWCPVKLVTV